MLTYYATERSSCGKIEKDKRVLYLQVKYHCQEKDEASYGEVNPLDITNCLYVVFSLEEEDIGTQYRSNHGTDPIESLRHIDTHFGISRRAAD
jgi:hypothetical protein